MTVDEYETIRLMDHEGLSQEECAEIMNVARTTVQLIYATARKKIGKVLVEGCALLIQGGDYQLSDQTAPFCKCGGRRRERLRRLFLEQEPANQSEG